MRWSGWRRLGVWRWSAPRVAINQLKIALEVIYILQQQSGGGSSSGKHNTGTETETEKVKQCFGKM